MAGLPYQTVSSDPRKAPKGKLPFMRDGATVVADSTFIRLHLEEAHGIDFDAGLTAFQRAAAWATEKMCEDHLYWTLVHARWIDEANFRKGPARFFDPVPAPIRPAIRAMVRRAVASKVRAQGMGRHTPAEIATLGIRDIAALAELLGDKPYLMGAEPCGADATVFAFVAGTLCPVFETPVRDAAERHPNLVAYRDRVMRRYFPEMRMAA